MVHQSIPFDVVLEGENIQYIDYPDLLHTDMCLKYYKI